MSRSRLLTAVLPAIAVVSTLGLAPKLSSGSPWLSSRDAARQAREVFDGVFQGSHNDLQLGPFELAYRVHRARMGSAEVFAVGLESVRRTDGGAVDGNDWALNFSLARAPEENGSRYRGNLTFDVGTERHVDVSLDSSRAVDVEEYQRVCSPDAGPPRTC